MRKGSGSVHKWNISVVICDTDIKYGSNIKHLPKQFGFQAAKSYDESFRKVRQFMNLEWGTINDELWRLAAYRNFSQSATGSKNIHRTNKTQSMSFHRRVQQQFPIGF